MTREDIIRMAKECGNWSGQAVEMNDVGLERFAKFVAAAERNKVAQWMIARSYATGHGDTVEDLLNELDWQVREEERELCAQVCDEIANKPSNMVLGVALDCADAIRTRGEKPWVKTYAGGKPNYTAPRQWQGLTDDERNQFRQWAHPEIIDAIELKLRERNP